MLNTDPRANIRKSTDIFRVMKAGTLYDPDALAAKMPPEAKPPAMPSDASAADGGRGGRGGRGGGGNHTRRVRDEADSLRLSA